MKNNIRIANLNDIDELEKLWSGYQKFYNVSEINSAKNKEFIRNIINKPSDGVIHIYILDSKIVGFTTIYFSYASTICERIGVLNDLFVKEDFRRKGIARELLKHAKDFTLSKNIFYLRWTTQQSNVKAQQLYKDFVEPSDWLIYSLKLKG